MSPFIAALSVLSASTTAAMSGGNASPVAVAAPLPAQQSEVVVMPPTLKRWSMAISNELNDALRYPSGPSGRGHPEGTAWVDFTCSETGAPAAIRVSRPSGSHDLDRAAMNAVRRIKTMHPLPAGIGREQRYRAVIAFAYSQGSLDRQMRSAMSDPRLRTAGADSVVALMVPAPGNG